MSDKELVFRQRKRIMEDWRRKRLTWQEVKDKYVYALFRISVKNNTLEKYMNYIKTGIICTDNVLTFSTN